MKASVQYTDYKGTTAADRCDLFVERPSEMTQIIVQRFSVPLDPVTYKFVGVSVTGTQVNEVCAYFFFKNRQTHNTVKYFLSSVSMQSILDLFKRFEFQVGEGLEDIDADKVEEIVVEE